MGVSESSLDISPNISFKIKHGQNEILTVDDWEGVNLKSPTSRLGIYPSQVWNPNTGIVIGADQNSVYIDGPIKFRNSIKDKDGNEIIGGGGLKGEYTYENYHSVFTVGPGTELKLSGALTINDGYGDGESKLYDNTLKLSCSEAGMVESTIDISANISALEPIAEIRLSNQMDTSNKRVNFKFINGGDTVWGLNDWDGSLYVNGPVQFNGTITDKYGNEVTGGGGGGDISNIAWIDVNDRVIGDKEHGYVQFRGNSGVYLKYGDQTIVSGESFTGITLGGRSGAYDTHIVSPSALYINPTQVGNPSTGIKIGADLNSVYIDGPIKFNDTIIDKDGNEITGGGGGGTPYVWNHSEQTSYGSAEVLYLGQDKSGNRASVFTYGPLYIGDASIQSDNISNGTGIKIFSRDDQTESGYYALGLKLTTRPYDSVFTEGPQVCAYNEDTICLSGGSNGGSGILLMLHGELVCFKQDNKYVDFKIDDLIALKALLNK